MSVEFPVVGIGASAGGLKAFEEFFRNIPPDSGMAFVLIQHLAPHHESELAELLQTHIDMNVTQIDDGVRLGPNCIYVIPPGKSLAIHNGILQLSEPSQARGHRAPIDFFFRSLAEDQGENAVCIILSGTGSDGTQGLKAIKERAGITMVQTPDEAEYDGMPKSAVQTGLVDLVAPIAELAAKLVTYKNSENQIRLPIEEDVLSEDESQVLNRIFAQLHSHTGHDFTNYKRSTILRRISRRLQVNGLETLSGYLQFLRQNSVEVEALFKDFLISVTNFFRDPDAFEILQQMIVPNLFQGKQSTDQVRVWVAGCATGEEAYSIAILLCEYAATLKNPPEIQIFATDIDTEAIAYAREGLYPDTISSDIHPERLQRYFQHEGNGYRIKKSVRERILFANHNLLNDPPFSRLDLVSCRNLLIYFNRDIQEQILYAWHYALRSSAYLFLGSSESADAVSDLFRVLNKKQRIFQRHDNVMAPLRFPNLSTGFEGKTETPPTDTVSNVQGEALAELYHNWLLKEHIPASILVNKHYDIVYTFGHAGRFLRTQAGPASLNILQTILPPLRLDLRTALYQGFLHGKRIETRRLRVEYDDQISLVRMLVGPVTASDFPQDCMEIVFDEIHGETPTIITVNDIDNEDAQLAIQLEGELQRTKEHLQTLVEEYETSNEELKASNEELQSMNEELQSTTEELETGKEELQSMNEELITVNQELKSKVEELSRANSDLQNLMAATDIATVFLDRELCIKRFTPRILDLFNIIPGDMGRPFAHVSHKIDYDGLADDAEQVLTTLTAIEKELYSKNGHWYMTHLLPYRTIEDRIDGVVITFVDITQLKTIQDELTTRERQQQAVAELGLLALQNQPVQALLDVATNRVCSLLEIEFCKVLELQPDGNTLLLRAGQGWNDGLIGQATVPARDGSQASYTLNVAGSVIVDDFADETRFTPPSLLTDHEICCGISVVIQGADGPYGVLGAHSRTSHTFSQDDIHYLQAVANLLAQAINRKEAEAAVLLSEERFRTALKNAPISVFSQDEQLRYSWIYNPSKVAARSAEEILGRTDRELHPIRAEAEQLESIKRTVIRSGKSARHEVAMTFDDGVHYYDLTVDPLYGEGKKVIGVTCATIDLTEIRTTEMHLRHSEEMRRLALAGAQLGTWSYEVEHASLEVDQRYCQILDIEEPGSVTPETVLNIIHPDDRAEIRQIFTDALSVTEQTSWNREMRLLQPDGSFSWIISRCGVVMNERGNEQQVKCIAGIIMDITQRKVAEEQLQQLTQTLEQRIEERTAELKQSNQELENFAYAASHDLVSPLRGIEQLATWIAQDAGQLLPSSSQIHLAKIQQRATILQRLLHDLLLYSRVGNVREKVTRVEVADVLRQIESTLDLPKGFKIVVKGDLPIFDTEQAPLELVLRNLLNNAIKHHDRPEMGIAELSAEDQGEQVLFRVADNGLGIPLEYRQRVFEMFRSLKPRQETQSSGMGLALVKRIVEMRGGVITVEGNSQEGYEGQGTIFSFTWPKQTNR